jgi:hypothetical protein
MEKAWVFLTLVCDALRRRFLCRLVGHQFVSDDGPYTGTCLRCGLQHHFIPDGSFPVNRRK